MIKYTFILLFSCFLFGLYPSHKDRLIVEHADENIGKRIDGEQLRILRGNVHIRQDTLNMYCEQAVFNENMSKLIFTGNVLIDNGNRRLTAEKIDYYPDKNWADCFGKVSITSAKDSMYSDIFSYDFEEKNAVAEGNVYMYDQENQVEIWGQLGGYQSSINHSYVEKNAKLMRIDTASQDSFTVIANYLKYQSDSIKKALALDSVIILQGDLRATCDSAVYFPNEEIANLYINPFVLFEENELTGTYIRTIFDSLQIKTINVFGNAVARNHRDSLKTKTNVLRGKIIDFYIENKKPQTIVAKTNASSIYYMEENGVDQGNNFATSDTIFIFFKEGELDSIDIFGGSEGIFYPSDYKGEKAFE